MTGWQGYLVALVVGAFIGAGINGMRWEVKSLEADKAWQDAWSEREKAERKARDDAEHSRIETERKLSQQEQENIKNEQVRQAEIDRLNRCLRTGGCGLYVKAKCPSVPAVPSSSAAPVDPPGTARLDATAEQDYLEFRREYGKQLDTLRQCKVFADESAIKKAP